MKYKLFVAMTLLSQTILGQSDYTIKSVYGNLTDCDTLTKGGFIIWWDNTTDYSADAASLLDTINAIEIDALSMGLKTPPNPTDGFFYNIYLYNNGDALYQEGWGNGQGTDSNGYPYLTIPAPGTNDWVNFRHESFHVFQYGADSPGFAYEGDSQWYIEASANWYASTREPSNIKNFIEGESLVRLPHIPLWLSYDNYPSTYPNNWQRYVHQYAASILLYYLSNEEGVDKSILSEGFFNGTTLKPQEYFYTEIGPENYRQYFVNWASRMINNFDFLTYEQLIRMRTEWMDYADPADDHKITDTFVSSSPDWYSAPQETLPGAWAFNTYRIENNQDTPLTIQVEADKNADNYNQAYFKSQLLIQGSEGQRFVNLEQISDVSNYVLTNLLSTDTTIYLIVASVPEVFGGFETFSYELKLHFEETEYVELEEPLSTVNDEEKKIIQRFNLMGQIVSEDHKGLHVLRYSDGSIQKIWVK